MGRNSHPFEYLSTCYIILYSLLRKIFHFFLIFLIFFLFSFHDLTISYYNVIFNSFFKLFLNFFLSVLNLLYYNILNNFKYIPNCNNFIIKKIPSFI
nr:MAG TPA: hypothetical protein [Caudoviricetes sp.]